MALLFRRVSSKVMLLGEADDLGDHMVQALLSVLSQDFVLIIVVNSQVLGGVGVVGILGDNLGAVVLELLSVKLVLVVRVAELALLVAEELVEDPVGGSHDDHLRLQDSKDVEVEHLKLLQIHMLNHLDQSDDRLLLLLGDLLLLTQLEVTLTLNLQRLHSNGEAVKVLELLNNAQLVENHLECLQLLNLPLQDLTLFLNVCLGHEME
jgi:hypothetical protein